MKPTYDKIALRKTLASSFSLDEMRLLCADLDIAFDDIAGETRERKALELIMYMDRRGRLADLSSAMSNARPASAPSENSVAQSSQYQSEPRQIRGSAYERSGMSTALGPIKNRYAVLIGIDVYVDRSFAKLSYCGKDVLAMARRLHDIGYLTKVLYEQAHDEALRPTKTNVLAELAVLCEGAGADDLILVQFACHGEFSDGEPILIMRDTRKSLPGSALKVSEIEHMLRRARARRQVVLLDACHVGLDTRRGDALDPQFVQNVYDRAQGFALLAGSTAQQAAFESAEHQQGLFTKFVLQGLSGDAKVNGANFVTVDSLRTYVLDQMRRWHFIHGGALQEPTSRSDAMGDMILADFR